MITVDAGFRAAMKRRMKETALPPEPVD